MKKLLPLIVLLSGCVSTQRYEKQINIAHQNEMGYAIKLAEEVRDRKISFRDYLMLLRAHLDVLKMQELTLKRKWDKWNY